MQPKRCARYQKSENREEKREKEGEQKRERQRLVALQPSVSRLENTRSGRPDKGNDELHARKFEKLSSPPSSPLLLSVSYPHFASFMAPSVVSRSEYFRPSSVRKPMNGRWEHTIAALSSLGVHLDAPTRIIFTSDQRLSVSLSLFLLLSSLLLFLSPSFPLSPFLLSPSSFAHDADSAALRVRSLVTFPASNPKLSFRPAWRDDDANFT